jgi:hypothetical protein
MADGSKYLLFGTEIEPPQSRRKNNRAESRK